MFLRTFLLVVLLAAALLTILVLIFPAHTAIIITAMNDAINPRPSMTFEAIGIDGSRLKVSEESKSYARDALLENYPVGTDFQQAWLEFEDAGVICSVTSIDLSDDHFETKLSEEDRGTVYRCSGEFGGSRVTPCFLFFDVQTDADARISDYWVNIGCTGP